MTVEKDEVLAVEVDDVNNSRICFRDHCNNGTTIYTWPLKNAKAPGRNTEGFLFAANQTDLPSSIAPLLKSVP